MNHPQPPTSPLGQAQRQIRTRPRPPGRQANEACENGLLYVEPGWAGVSAWLIAAAVIALAAIVAAGGLYATRTAGDLSTTPPEGLPKSRPSRPGSAC